MLPWSPLPVLALAFGLGIGAASQAQTPWSRPDLPSGGTVRSLAADPLHPGAVLLGTATGDVYRSRDAGVHWAYFSRISTHGDWVVAALVADQAHPGRWFAGLWSWANADGGIYTSSDDGANWTPVLLHHAVRALAQAPSAPATIVAATLEGVYRTQDSGASWQLISPAQDRELQNVESVAVDPENAREIYVGTWHLPWKTVNGGHDWWQMRDGVIDDSDVFSITVDRQHPATVYLSACSGIYRSDNRGNVFRKIQGIPYSARRTPALVQDASEAATVYAGTTQGLWVTHDAGASWARMTSAALRVNAVLEMKTADGPRMLLGTDFAGVYAGRLGGDAALSFVPSNDGFASRHVAAAAASAEGQYLALTGDDAWGGIFYRSAMGGAWTQLTRLPHALEATGLHWSPQGLLASTSEGIYRLAAARKGPVAPEWQLAPSARGVIHGLASPEQGSLDVFAASEAGLLHSGDGGLHWALLREAPAALYRVLCVPDDADPGAAWLYVAGNGFVLRSRDGGKHFLAGRLSLDGAARARIGALAAVQLASGVRLILASTTRGLYQSSDWGATWTLSGHGLPATDVRAVEFHDGGIYALTAEVGTVYFSRDGADWQPVQLDPALEARLREAPSLGRAPASAVAAVAAAARLGAGKDRN
ncbi:MAG TPA: hypothetical protein VN690_05285 [Terriglobales bacterium]|nr:hypothetical protein [Terriglobales bacterium]